MPFRVLIEPGASEAKSLPYIGLENIESGSGLLSDLASTPAQDSVASVTFRFDDSVVLYGKLRPYLRKVALPSGLGRCSTEIIPLRPTDLVSREYLWMLMRSDQIAAIAAKQAIGSRMPRVDLEALLDERVYVHPPAEQQRVVEEMREREALARLASSVLDYQVELAGVLPRALLRTHLGSDPILSVGPAKGSRRWISLPLTSVARLESGHTPSRRHPEWWGGDVPWLALPDIRKLHGLIARDTIEHTNDLGLANSSARLLPVNTVCLCRDASIGFVTMLGRPMATSQHFCNWVCDPEKLDAEFLMYAFMASFDYLRGLGSGSVLKTIYMPTIESFHICAPKLDEQRRIAKQLRNQLREARQLRTQLTERQALIERLPQRLLADAFGAAD